VIAKPLRFCTLSGTVEDIAGDPIENAFVRVRILDGKRAVVGATALSSAPQSAYTSEDGSFAFTLPRGALARIEIPESGLDASFTVTDAGSMTLEQCRLREYEPS
jgi:hypothetical protein